MDEKREMQKILNHSLSGLKENPFLAQRVIAQAKGEKPVVKKISASMILVIVILCLTLTAIAAGIIYNQEWYWNNRNSPEKEYKPEVYGELMENMEENPAQQADDDGLVQVAVREVSWAPGADVMTVSLSAAPKDPARYELYSRWSLDEDGAGFDEDAVDVTEDGEDRAVHWLWRNDIGLGESRGYGQIPGFGPVAAMMDDSSKQMIMLDPVEVFLVCPAETGSEENVIPLNGSTDMYRTAPEGDVWYWAEFDLAWLRQDMEKAFGKEGAETRWEEICKDGMKCRLEYRIVKYLENDELEYGENRSVEFTVRPKNP